MDEYVVNTVIELYSIIRRGYASEVSSAVEEVTGRRAISFSQFASDYSKAFR